MATLAEFRNRSKNVLREIIGPAAWLYLIVQVAIFDLDAAVARLLGPSFAWVPRYKFFVLLALTAALVLTLGAKEFRWFLLFVLAYPMVFVWRVIKRMLPRWPLGLLFLPVVWASVTRFWSTFLRYALGLVAAAVILVADGPVWIVTAIGYLAVFLAIHLWRSIRAVYAQSPFTRLVSWARKIRSSVEGGTVKLWTPAPSSGVANSQAPSAYQNAYTAHALAQIIGERVKTVVRRRFYDLYLLVSWCYTVILTAVVFGLVDDGLYKIAAGAYAGAQGAGFLSFLGFSFGMLVHSSISTIRVASAVASVSAYLELVCSVVILVIFASMLLSAAREAFRENLNELTAQLDGVAHAIEGRIATDWQLTPERLEIIVLTENVEAVNSVRTLRGLPELPASGTTDSTKKPA
jgi:hypothetical protein